MEALAPAPASTPTHKIGFRAPIHKRARPRQTSWETPTSSSGLLTCCLVESPPLLHVRHAGVVLLQVWCSGGGNPVCLPGNGNGPGVVLFVMPAIAALGRARLDGYSLSLSLAVQSFFGTVVSVLSGHFYLIIFLNVDILLLSGCQRSGRFLSPALPPPHTHTLGTKYRVDSLP